MNNSPWQQVNITFPEGSSAEQTALACLRPVLCSAEDEGAVSSWFFIRKSPCWRVRYLPAEQTAAARIRNKLTALEASGHIDSWTTAVYEPEVHAFGGTDAMDAAHRLFHRDSRSLMSYLDGGPDTAVGGHRREMTVMLCSLLMRSAGLDWYEQGDVWARVAEHRALPEAASKTRDRLHAAVSRLVSVDAEDQMHEGGPLAAVAGWAQAYTAAGRETARLAASGMLHRGLRDVLAHHVLFAWNRIGLPYDMQAALASTAKDVIFGPDPAAPAAADAGRFLLDRPQTCITVTWE